MLYPLFTYTDGTEITASKPDKDNNISVYIEKFDDKKDDFINATIILPEGIIKSSSGYSEEELKKILFENI